MDLHSGKRTRTIKQTKEQVNQKIGELYLQLINHTGEPAILFEKEGRAVVPYFVNIGNHTPGRLTVVAYQRCYHSEGGFNCWIPHTIEVVKLLIGEQKIVYFDDI